MAIFAKIKDWSQTRRDRKAGRLADDFTDIVSLYRKGIIGVKATGQSITDIHAEVKSRVRVPLKVAVAHGTYFVSTGNHQNMVTRRRYRFDLDPMESRTIHVPAACINANLPIPQEKDGFKGVSRVPDKLSKFLEAAQDEDPMVVQAGVWAITDNYTAHQIQQHLRLRQSDRYGSVGSMHDAGAAISDSQIARAREILNRLEIRTNL